jgi:2-polyprenyl-3-methyl-5-hydroxy-6-metoxy-1,4-benzoquinol methylase
MVSRRLAAIVVAASLLDVTTYYHPVNAFHAGVSSSLLRPHASKQRQRRCERLSLSPPNNNQQSTSSEHGVTATTAVTQPPIRRLPLATAIQDLQQLLQANDTDTLVYVEGYVISKRGFGSSFCFVDVTDAHHGSTEAPPVQVMLKRQDFSLENNNNNNYFDGYMQSMLPGIRVGIVGVVAPSRNPGEALLLARRFEIRDLPRNPQHIRILLQAVHNGLLPLVEVAHAAQWSAPDLQAALTAATTTTTAESTTTHLTIETRLHGLAKAILKSMPPPRPDEPVEILATKNQRGVYTLPLPDKVLQQPPPELERILAVRQSSNNNNQDGIKNYDAEPLTVPALLASKVSTDRGTAVCPSDRVVGWVQNRRRFLHNVTVLEVVARLERVTAASTTANDHHYDNNNNNDRTQHAQLWNQRLKCVLHPAVVYYCTSADATTDCSVLGQLLAPGSQVQLEGYYFVSAGKGGDEHDDDASAAALFWVTHVRLLRASWRPSVVQYLIELLVHGKFDRQEAASALRQSDTEIDNILDGTKDLTSRQWKAAEISAQLQDAESRMALISPESMRVLDKFASLRTQYRVQQQFVAVEAATEESSRGTEGSRWKRKKEPQLDWMAQQVKEVIQSHPDFGRRSLKILDVGGGKGYLANHLAGLLGDAVQIRVIDVAQGAVKNGAMRAKRLQLPVEYTAGDASKVDFSGDVDLVVALHACGALTDVALGHAISNAACFVICPCCFRSNPTLQVTLPSAGPSGIDRIRVEEWLGVDPIDYDVLKLLAEVQGDIALANQAIHTICALRASALAIRSERQVNVAIRTFPMAFSSRNFCLVGSYSS